MPQNSLDSYFNENITAQRGNEKEQGYVRSTLAIR